ncbi:MAG: HD domain-containing protein [Actinomycetota bacterium]|nr:HD domain-containing protein [Actinomycetota bacterium]
MTFVVRRRQDRERLEHQLLSPPATKADQSQGRAQPEEPDDYRTDFERDRDRVIHSKAFRRLKHKTQVFLNPEGDHFVTRLTHTLQVMQVGRAMAVSLGLNETLTEAICLAHDVGHSPFGHVGEEALSPFVDGEWLHSAHGVRTLTVVEPLNLTWETLDGVRAHSWRVDPHPATPEGALCRFADRIAYLTHDVADAIRAGVLRYDDIPHSARNRFGATSREWIDAMITSVVETSASQGSVLMDPGDLEVMNDLRAFMFERVYLSRHTEGEKQRAIKVIRDLVEYFAAHRNEIPRSATAVDAEPLVAAIDYVAGMTDRYAIRTHDRLYRPTLF